MRATVDLDDPDALEIVKAWHLLSRYGDGLVRGRVSSSGEGVHLKVHECDREEVELVRALCGDDRRRMDFDREARVKPSQILFSQKREAVAGDWLDDLDRLIDAYGPSSPEEVDE